MSPAAARLQDGESAQMEAGPGRLDRLDAGQDGLGPLPSEHFRHLEGELLVLQAKFRLLTPFGVLRRACAALLRRVRAFASARRLVSLTHPPLRVPIIESARVGA